MCLCLQKSPRLQRTVGDKAWGRLRVAAGWHRHRILTGLLPSTGNKFSAYAGNAMKATNGDREPAVDICCVHDVHITFWEQALLGGHCQLWATGWQACCSLQSRLPAGGAPGKR